MNRFRSKGRKVQAKQQDAQKSTGVALPHLTQRFALLRDEDGALISFETMQSHLKAQRANGRLTEDEELAVLHEFSMQSAQEARVPSPLGFDSPPRSAPPFPTWNDKPQSDKPSPPRTLDDFHRMRASSSTSQVSRFGGIRRDDPFKISPSASLPNLSMGNDETEEIAPLPVASTSRPRPRPRNSVELSATQIHRISRVLDDIELSLYNTHSLPDDTGEITSVHRTQQYPAGPSPAKSRLIDEDTEEIDPHMAKLRSREPSPVFSQRAAMLGVPAPAFSRAASNQSSVYKDAVEDQNDLDRSPTPIAAAQNGSPATLRHANSFAETSTTGSPAFSPLASRFPAVPEREHDEQVVDDEEEEEDVTRTYFEDETANHTSSGYSSTNPPSFLLSPILNASNSSLASAGSSYNSDDPGDHHELLDGPSKRKHEPFEFETASHYHDDRNAVAQMAADALGGLDLEDVAFIQDHLVRSASSRATSRLARSGSDGSSLEGHSRREPTPATKERQFDDHLEEVEEEEEELDTPLLTSDASHSPKDLFTDGLVTPGSDASSSSSWKPPRPPMSSLHRSAPSQDSQLNASISSSTISRTPISNPSYVPGRVQRFPTRNSNGNSADGGHSASSSLSHGQLHEQVAAHANAATAALKRPAIPPSPTTEGKVSPTLRRHKSQKSIKLSDISSPQLVATSANLAQLTDERPTSPPPVPPISPHHVRKQSSTMGLRSKMFKRFDSGGRPGPNGDEITPYELPPISASTETGSPRTSAPQTPQTPAGFVSPDASTEDYGSPLSSPARAASPMSTPGGGGGSSLGRVFSRFRKNKADSPSPSPALPSPPMGSLPASPMSTMSPTRPLAVPLNLSYSQSIGLGLNGSGSSPRSSRGGTDWRTQISHPTPIEQTPPLFTNRARPAPPPLDAPLPSPPASTLSRHNSDVDSIRQLMQAAADLGIDADKVGDLIASTYEGGPSDPSRTVVRRTVILSAPPPGVNAPAAAPQRDAMRRSQTLKEPARTGGHAVRHRRSSSEAGALIMAPRRSISDRPPTPPPDAHQHRRRRSADLLREAMPPVPISPALSGASVSPPSTGKSSTHGLAVPQISPTRRSYRTDHTHSSYTGSLLDFYGDYAGEMEEEDHTIVLAKGRIPSPSHGMGETKEMPTLPAAVTGAAAAGARVEVDEMQDGSLVWQVIRNLRSSDTSGDAVSAFHSRQSSNASSMMHLAPPAPLSTPLLGGRLSATSGKSSISAVSTDAADALRLMIRRDRSPMASPRPDGGAAVGRPSFSSERSVQVYEADTEDVGAIIDELSKGDAGSFNLVRNQSLKRVMQQRKEAGSYASRQAAWRNS